LNQEVYEKIAGVYGQILKAPEHKEYAEAQQKNGRIEEYGYRSLL